MKQIAKVFSTFWQGRARLWQAFWLVGLVGFLAWTLLLFYLSRALLGETPNRAAALILFALPYVAGIIYAGVAVWRCAPNTAYAPLTALARVWVLVFYGGWLYRAGELVVALVV